MKELTLRYSATKLSSLAYDSAAAQQMSFSPVKFPPPVIATTEETGITLTGHKYNHVLYVHASVEAIISADELTQESLDFLQAFWRAGFKYLSRKVNGSWSNYIQVMTEGGRFPISYLEDLRDLPEVALNLSYAEPI